MASIDTRAKEEKLVLAAQDGNERAFEALYRLYQPSLLRFSFRLCNDDAMALDAVQDAWMLTLRTLKQSFPPDTFRARVFKAVRWRTFDRIRRRGRAAADELIEEQVSEEKPEAWATSDQLRRLIKALPEGEGEALYLFYLEDLSVAEIATIQDVPTGTVKSRLSRARNRLRKEIETPNAPPSEANSDVNEASQSGPSHDRIKLEIVK